MAAEEKSDLTMIERIERALVLLAYFIELDGDVYVPMYEKFEAELDELMRREDTKSRARQRLRGYINSRNGRPPSGDDAVVGVGSGFLDSPDSEPRSTRDQAP
jgi:hypothetical protein